LRTKYRPKPTIPHKFQNKKPPLRNFPSHGKKYYSYMDQDELRRKKLCFSCQEPWAPGHKCVKGKAHYIEVFSESDEEGIEEAELGDGDYETAEEEEQPHQNNSKIAVLSGVPRFHTLRLKGVLQGQKITVLVDGGATHNFIDSALVERRKLPTEPFEGFTVVIPGNHTMECNRWIPDLQVKIGDYTVKDNFYVVNVADTNMVLGVQWLYSIGEHSVNYQIPQISFKDAEGKSVVLKGMNTYPSQVISAKSMRSVMRHGDIEWAVECQITTEGTTAKVSS